VVFVNGKCPGAEDMLGIAITLLAFTHQHCYENQLTGTPYVLNLPPYLVGCDRPCTAHVTTWIIIYVMPPVVVLGAAISGALGVVCSHMFRWVVQTTMIAHCELQDELQQDIVEEIHQCFALLDSDHSGRPYNGEPWLSPNSQ
jgi:hypothetical protein